MNTNLDINLIRKRIQKLEAAKKALKKHFVGIDSIIDSFIENIKIWYILPEVQTRPLIINLWGMTGIGKTDLIRRFVNFIDFNDRFIEVQMDNDNNSYYSKIQDHIENVLDDSNEQGILLLDEMQRFRTVEEDGLEIKSSKYHDLWMLLSDGKFDSDSKNRRELMEMLLDSMYSRELERYEQENENCDEEYKVKTGELKDEPDVTPSFLNSGNVKVGTPIPKLKRRKKIKKTELKYKTWSYSARRLKKLLKLEEDIEEIMTWGEDKRLSVIRSGLKSKRPFEGNVFSKLVVVISGNLDEAFKEAKNVEDADSDADIFHEHSKRVNFVDIKRCLTRRFKPEQIARLGNTHIIYPSLKKDSYRKIIKNKVKEICDLVYKKHKIKINVDSSVLGVIYRNGVFPTQGVRPVLSTISSLFENSLPSFIYNALLSNSDLIHIKYKDGFFFAYIDNKKIEYKITRAIEKIKEDKSTNEDASVAVHEAGHAVLYALCFKLAPTQIVCKTSNKNNEGFTGTHSFSHARKNILDNIAVAMGGICAEELVFGEEFVSNGSSGDIAYCTQMASDFYRRSGFENSSTVISNISDKESLYNQDIEDTNLKIEKLINVQRNHAKELLQQNEEFFKKVVKELFNNKELNSVGFIKIAKKYVPDIKELSANKIYFESYYDKMNEFLKNSI